MNNNFMQTQLFPSGSGKLARLTVTVPEEVMKRLKEVFPNYGETTHVCVAMLVSLYNELEKLGIKTYQDRVNKGLDLAGVIKYANR
jgi:hypothetical protein|nr:MAG TPA: transcriptional repressor [Caudoviricetes sp.]